MDDARAKVGDGGMPKARLGFLRLGGKEIEIVDAEDIKLLEEEHHLRLGDGHEIAWRESSERGGITLGETEEMLKLNDKGGIDNLAHAISMIVRLFLYGERTVGENDHSLAAVALADHLGVGRTLEEVKLGVGDNLLKVVYVEPGKPPYEAEILHTLEAQQKAVGGFIEPVYLEDDITLVGNEESKLIGMPGNRRLDSGSIIAGPTAYFTASVSNR